ncbi:hypothetical protein DY000_02030396 [Brassica cretica]|uniref:Uncharacterized protein n=1 Tax=Brassica cretica TaxID=69181 RepID=A0ABQ7DHG7_BRACR|nr:hypothetical protein DY000_02030396 [Brassica cretica]
MWDICEVPTRLPLPPVRPQFAYLDQTGPIQIYSLNLGLLSNFPLRANHPHVTKVNKERRLGLQPAIQNRQYASLASALEPVPDHTQISQYTVGSTALDPFQLLYNRLSSFRTQLSVNRPNQLSSPVTTRNRLVTVPYYPDDMSNMSVPSDQPDLGLIQFRLRDGNVTISPKPINLIFCFLLFLENNNFTTSLALVNTIVNW